MNPERRFAELAAAGGPLEELVACIGLSFDPDASLNDVGDALDELGAGCPHSFDGVLSLFATRLRGDTEDYHDPRNSYLHAVLARGVGMPITLSVVAMCVGGRVGVAVDGASLPGHFVVRESTTGRVGDPFNGGRLVTAGPVVAYTPVMIAARILNNLTRPLLERNRHEELATLTRLRSVLPEFAGEAGDYRVWMRDWN